MRLDDYDTEPRWDATVLSSERITPASSPDDVRELLVRIDSPGVEADVGQSFGVLVPGPHEAGQPHHMRLYTVADIPTVDEDGQSVIRLCVKRCSWIDEFTGERHEGIASRYLCDRKAGDSLTVTGPYGLAFDVPPEPDAHLVLIGMGTGIAPFRALVKHIYQRVSNWNGRITLFHGARSGLELLYRNDALDDFAQYYDLDTFEAIEALSPRPHWTDEIAWDQAVDARREELWRWFSEPKTWVYVAGLESVRAELDRAFAKVAGSEEAWARRKAEMTAGGRWVELLY